MDKRYKILNPKQSGLTGKNKPMALVVNSPYCNIDNATNSQLKQNHLKQSGFTILNKKPINFHTEKDSLSSFIKIPYQSNSKLTIFMHTHGLPGWFFSKSHKKGPNHQLKAELRGLYFFAKFIKDIENFTRTEIDNIVLSGCYSAIELYNPMSGKYFNSPARLLSMLFPQKHILGFLGQYADAKVTNIYKEKAGQFYAIVKQPHDASILFKNGDVILKPNKLYFFETIEIPDFVSGALELNKYSKPQLTKPFLFKETYNRRDDIWYTKKANMGKKQLYYIDEIKNRIDSEFANELSTRMNNSKP